MGSVNEESCYLKDRKVCRYVLWTRFKNIDKLCSSPNRICLHVIQSVTELYLDFYCFQRDRESGTPKSPVLLSFLSFICANLKIKKNLYVVTWFYCTPGFININAEQQISLII